MIGVLSDNPVFPILLSVDLDASRTFYHGVLGLEILRADVGDRIVFRCGGGTQLAVTASTVWTTDTQTQMAWRVPDIHAAVAELRTRGVRIEEYVAPDPVTVDGIADMGHSWAAWLPTQAGTSSRWFSRRGEGVSDAGAARVRGVRPRASAGWRASGRRRPARGSDAVRSQGPTRCA